MNDHGPLPEITCYTCNAPVLLGQLHQHYGHRFIVDNLEGFRAIRKHWPFRDGPAVLIYDVRMLAPWYARSAA